MSSPVENIRRRFSELSGRIGRPVRLMEVCGSHSFAIAKYGIRALLPPGVSLVSGPGCPVCVAGENFICRAIQLARKGVKVALFGDLLRIPSPLGTLREEKGLLVIYSPEEALEYALAHPSEEVVFAAVGFAPTLCATAALMEEVRRIQAKNFSLLCDFKLIRPVLERLAPSLDGFLLPGHVAAVTGEAEFRDLSIPGVIAGFQAENIISSLCLLLQQIAENRNAVLNNYAEVVPPAGNTAALALIDRVFEPGPGNWRGIGNVPGGNALLRSEFSAWDAVKRHHLELEALPAIVSSPCRCGDVLSGKIFPRACSCFGTSCTPEHPLGACMVSQEGACGASWYNPEVAR